jgi:uncharacterized protein YqgC (DUF456 family)
MDTFWILLGAVLMVVGIVGCILPFLPGPPLCFVALVTQQMREQPPISAAHLWTFAGVTLTVIVLEFVIPLYGTKRYGGSKYGMWGCTIGLMVGLFLGPIGIIVGPMVGAFIGEMVFKSNSATALRAAVGSFIGFLAGTVLKLIACLVMAFYFVASIWQ